ncbi:myelin-oligodendrocyte glycoprotein-like isoform X2 [Acanthochromis polyacanthus]|uniref:myelin-oligodendrocyte glycoprotein-like isoform X2 n=1 Tax=Acanthochromis polyacanthus TaxID=80966 RepID=UPI002234C620|nr:myelin-oligodendrocyte glycoprotein-like isoform X2 [Acanthochromis polyacanthus]
MELYRTVSFWSFTLCSAFVLSTPTDGQRQVVGPAQPIIAALGDDVILPCHLEPMADVQGKTVVWSKPDLKPDPLNPQRGVDYVHLYRNRKELPDRQIPLYSGRTSLFKDELKNGNISLKITNVTLEDHGRYKCFISRLNSKVNEAILQLIVVPSTVETSTTELPLNPGNLQTPDPLDKNLPKDDYSTLCVVIPLVVLLVFTLVAVCAYFLVRRSQQNNLPDKDAPQKKPLTV